MSAMQHAAMLLNNLSWNIETYSIGLVILLMTADSNQGDVRGLETDQR
jgi:hypothetical protein